MAASAVSTPNASFSTHSFTPPLLLGSSFRPQAVGEIAQVDGFDLSGTPLDCIAHALDTRSIERAAIALVEVKNVHEWIYPDSRELWQLLVAAAPVVAHHPVVPVLVCVRHAYQVLRMAMDLGFFVCALRDQVFSPAITAAEFDAVAEEFGLLMRRHEGPHEHIESFLTGKFRRSPPLSRPPENIEWFRRQAQRFSAIAPIVRAHSALADALAPTSRRAIFKSFATTAVAATSWPLQRGWS
jgi:hypothetical protein